MSESIQADGHRSVAAHTITDSTVHTGDVHQHHYSTPTPFDLEAAQRLLDAVPLDAIPAPAVLPTPHRMPFSRNPYFVGRADDLRPHLAKT